MSDKKDRFLYYTNSVYCEELGMERIKTFVSVWFTCPWSFSEQW